MDWTLLRSFLAIHRAGSMAAAARAQGLQQPTLSRHLNELEAQLGTLLFERTGRGLHPTAAAAAVLTHALRMEDAAASLCLAMHSRSEGLSGTVRVYASQLLASTLLPPALAQLLETQPGLQIDLQANDDLPDLLTRDADIGVWLSEPAQPDVVSRHLGEVRIRACASPGYLARHGEPRNLEQLRSHRLVGHDKLPTMTRWFQQQGLPIRREDFALRTDDKASCLQLLRAGAGIGFVADYLLSEASGLQPICPELPLPRLPLWISTHREVARNGLIKVVFDSLSESLQAQPYGLARGWRPIR